MAKNIYHAEMALLIRREKEIERKLQALTDDFKTWKERIAMAKQAGKDELAARAEAKVEELKTDALMLRQELVPIIDQKKKLRRQSQRPSGQELQRSKAILDDFRKSGLIDPEQAQMQEMADDAQADQDLDALKSQMNESPSSTSAPPTDDNPQEAPHPKDALDADLAALRQKMGADADDDTLDDDAQDLEELEKLLQEPSSPAESSDESDDSDKPDEPDERDGTDVPDDDRP